MFKSYLNRRIFDNYKWICKFWKEYDLWWQDYEAILYGYFYQKGSKNLSKRMFLGFYLMPYIKRQYLSQIRLDLYETFRTTFWGCPKMIQHSKVDQIILNSSREPSMSFNYDHILDALLIMLGSWQLAHNLKMTFIIDSWCKIWYQRWSNPPKL